MPKFSKLFNALKDWLSSKQSGRKISKLSDKSKDNKPGAFKDIVNLDIVNAEKPKKVDRGLKRFIKDVFISLEQQMRSLYWLQRMKHLFIIAAPVPSSYNKYANLARKEHSVDSFDKKNFNRRMNMPAKAEVISRKLSSQQKEQRISYKNRINKIKDPYGQRKLSSGISGRTAPARQRFSFSEMISLQKDTGRTM